MREYLQDATRFHLLADKERDKNPELANDYERFAASLKEIAVHPNMLSTRKKLSDALGQEAIEKEKIEINYACKQIPRDKAVRDAIRWNMQWSIGRLMEKSLVIDAPSRENIDQINYALNMAANEICDETFINQELIWDTRHTFPIQWQFYNPEQVPIENLKKIGEAQYSLVFQADTKFSYGVSQSTFFDLLGKTNHILKEHSIQGFPKYPPLSH